MPVSVFISSYLYWMLKRKEYYNDLVSFYKNKVFYMIVFLCYYELILLIFSDLKC